MPVRIPSGLYSAGGFTVDMSPLVQVVKQRQAEKKAAREAAAKYFSGLQDKINTAGVRSVDLEGGLQNKIDNWVNQGTANLDKISKGGQGYSDFVKGYKGILGDIEKSKNRAKFETDLGKAQFEGKYDPDADDLHVLSKVGKSIYDPGSYKEDGVSEYTYGDIPSNVPPFDPSKQTQFFTATFGKSKPTYDESSSRVDNITGTVFVPKEYNDESVKEIAENAKNVFYGDKSAQKHYKNQLANESWMKDANKAYQSIYGDQDMVNSPEKAAQADAIMRARLSGEEVEVKDPNYAQKLKEAMADKRFKQQKALQDRRQAAINARAKSRGESGGKKQPNISYGELYSQSVKADPQKQGYGRIRINDIYGKDYDAITGGAAINAIVPKKDPKTKELYFQVNPDGSWEGQNGVINKTRVLDQPIEAKKDVKGSTSSVSPDNAPAEDVAISKYPKNIQDGIVAFSQKNNLPLSDALSILKEQRPEIFS